MLVVYALTLAVTALLIPPVSLHTGLAEGAESKLPAEKLKLIVACGALDFFVRGDRSRLIRMAADVCHSNPSL